MDSQRLFSCPPYPLDFSKKSTPQFPRLPIAFPFTIAVFKSLLITSASKSSATPFPYADRQNAKGNHESKLPKRVTEPRNNRRSRQTVQHTSPAEKTGGEIKCISGNLDKAKIPLRQISSVKSKKSGSHSSDRTQLDTITGMQSGKEVVELNGHRPTKRAKKCSDDVQYVLKLNMCSKHGDLHGALAVYDTAKKGVFKLKQQQYNVLLYICSAAASGSLSRRKFVRPSTVSTNKEMNNQEENMHEAPEETTNFEVISFSQEDMELAAKKGIEIYEEMLRENVPLNEATFTSVARLAVAKGDGDIAFETVKKMTAANIAPKLRSYGPPLLCFCKNNQVEKAFEVDDHMIASGVLPDENLLQALLGLSVAAGLEGRVYSLLHRLRTTVRDLLPTTVEKIEEWFNSQSATCVGKDNEPSKEDILEAVKAGGGGWHGLGWLGRGQWKTVRTTISKTGSCLSCGEKLCTIDLDPNETQEFAKSVAKLAFEREKDANNFKSFQSWLDGQEPFEAVIDGANIGLYNSMNRGFNFQQVSNVADAVKAKNPTGKPPLIVLHCRRTSDRGQISPRSQLIVDDWVDNKSLYSTPYGSNDDWYWLYAAVRCKALLVTNDEMRDHIFQLLGNDFFPKWKERHQVRFTFSTNGLELFMPPPYSTVIQESISGCWHFPQTGSDDIESPREWLCVTRSSKDRFSETKSTSRYDMETQRNDPEKGSCETESEFKSSSVVCDAKPN